MTRTGPCSLDHCISGKFIGAAALRATGNF